MKSINNTDHTATTSNDEALASIDTVALDDVTGGCAACGQNCAAGPAPTAAAGGQKLQNPFGAFARR